MESNATELYLMFNDKTKKSPGQWLMLSEVKSFIKENKIKKPKKNKDGEYTMAQELFDLYNDYISGSNETVEEQPKLKLVEAVADKFGNENLNYMQGIFFQKIFGKTIPQLFKETRLNHVDIIEDSEDAIKLIYIALTSQLIVLAKTEKIINKSWVENRTHEILNNLISAGVRRSSDVLYQDDKLVIKYNSVKEK
jgi:hypothetical protein